MKEDIVATKEMIKKQVDVGKIFMFGIPFSKYQRVYGFTNENINGYLSQFSYEGTDRALTVMASGDHFLNLAYYGIHHIDTFDSNQLTEYYALGIKRAAILSFSYHDYLQFYEKILNPNTSLEELTELVWSLLPFMELKHKIYWESILSFNYQIQKDKKAILNLFHMLLINIHSTHSLLLKNTYLLSEENYNLLRKNLASVQIQFKCCDCLDLQKYFYSYYDFIFLSNIPDYFFKKFGYYWEYPKLVEAIAYFKKLLLEGGILGFAYLIECYSLSDAYKTNLILNSNIKKEDLTTEEILLVPHISNNSIAKTIKDGLLLERKL